MFVAVELSIYLKARFEHTMLNTGARVALIGKSGAGKSETARVLADRLGLRPVKTGLVCREISRLLFGNEDKRSTQLIDDALTDIDNSIFLNASLRDVDLSIPFVIDSLRFDSDFEIARKLDCTIVRVVASDAIRQQRLIARGQGFNPETDGNHRSEMELDDRDVDLILNNEGSLPELIADIERNCN